MLAVFSNKADGEVRNDAYPELWRANAISSGDYRAEVPTCTPPRSDDVDAYCLALVEQENRKVRAEQLVLAAKRQKEIEDGEAWLAQQEQISSSLQSSYASASTGSSAPSPAYEPGSIQQTIVDAAIAYGQDPNDALRIAECESSFNPYASNGTHFGLFQFLPSTWASTPYAAQDYYNPWSNANAAMWMWSVGRRGEWECQ